MAEAELELLRGVALALADADSLEQAACVALEQLIAHLDLEVGHFFLLEEDGAALRAIAAVGLTADFTRRFARLPLELDTLTVRAVRTRSTQLVDARNPEDAPITMRAAGTRIAVAVPVFAGAALRGAFVLGSGRSRRLTPDEVRLVELTAALAAGAVAAAARAEEAACRAVELTAVIDAVPEAVMLVDRDGTLRVFNEAYRRLSDRPVVAGERACAADLAASARDPDGTPLSPQRSPTAAALRGEAAEEIVRWTRPGGGALVTARVSSTPLRDSEGVAIGAVTVLADISRERAVEQLKDDFLAQTAHELRNPLAGMKAQLQLVLTRLAGGRLGHERLLGALGAIEQEVDRLTAICSEVIDLSRLESAQLRLYPTPFDLRGAVGELVGRVAGSSPRHQITLEGGDTVPLTADRARVAQIVQHLLGNAVRFSPRGGRVAVRVGCSDGEATVEVRDDGNGIALADLPRIFERYFQVGHERSGRSAGLGVGVGLYFARQLATRMGGRLEARSDGPGLGAELTLTLPSVATG